MKAYQFIILFSILNSSNSILAQKADEIIRTDTNEYKIPEITIVGHDSKTDIVQMPEIVGTSIYAGLKSSLVLLDKVQGNVANNTMRQVLAKVPGIHVWESDGSGIQIGIAARGLSPNRSWEFNIRQNGYDIAADPFGYPEAYYNPPLQAVQRIEVVRGQGALQYGAQFGGLVNYILRNGSDIQKPFQFESIQTIGSFGLFNSYNAIGGKKGKFNYYGFFDHRSGDGWRKNSAYYTNTGFASISFRPTLKWSLTAELMHYNMRSQQPGGLTDAQFETDARQSFRSRNWVDISWTTAALINKYHFNENHSLNVKLFAVLGDRNSVGFLRAITVADTINRATLAYNPRTVDIDKYRNYGMEARYLGNYPIGAMESTISGGMRLYTGGTERYRDGKGSTQTGYDIGIEGIFPRDIRYSSANGAVFVENIFRFWDSKFLVIPGIRYEYLLAKASGRNGYNADNTPILLTNESRGRGFLLAGIGTEFHATHSTEVYANITQAYRPMQFADLTAPPSTDQIDPNLKDSKGFNADLGYRGKWADFLFFDISGFYLQYNNRIGTITQARTDGSFYNYRTNVGNSVSKGFEGLVEWNILKTFLQKSSHGLSIFSSYSFVDARYADFKIITRSGNNLVETNLKNKKVENAPEHILRTGLTYSWHDFNLTGQISHVAKSFSDANNTETPNSNGQVGLIPAYTIADLTASYQFEKYFTIKAGINNLGNIRYFTRRAGGYPGPGLMPSDARSFFLSVGAKF